MGKKGNGASAGILSTHKKFGPIYILHIFLWVRAISEAENKNENVKREKFVLKWSWVKPAVEVCKVGLDDAQMAAVAQRLRSTQRLRLWDTNSLSNSLTKGLRLRPTNTIGPIVWALVWRKVWENLWQSDSQF